MVKNPLISIVVPSYNVAPYIRQCVESILNQTFSNWELLLVVGGTDGTIENPEKVVESIIEMSSSKVFSKLN